MTVAQTILDQMGGARRLAAFTGAKNFVSGENYLQFSIGKGARDKINNVKIALNAMDTYDVTFGRTYGTKYHQIKTTEDIYNTELMDFFEDQTGFFLTFGARS
mgnify:CR=1 FL=1